MFSDHENQTAAAAAPAQEENQNAKSESAAPEAPQAAQAPQVPKSIEPGSTEAAAEVHAATAEAAAAPIAQADGNSGSSSGVAPEHSGTAHAQTSAEEEAAGSEEMSKLIEQYDEQHEAAAQNEIIEVQVVAYTEQGVVVDLGGKTEGLIPASEFHESDIPRPEPNSTIEVQRTGETKEGYALVSYQKALRRRTWERLDAAFKGKETLTGKVVDRIKGGLVVDIG